MNRRTFIETSALTGVVAAGACHQARQSQWRVFTDDEASILAALCDQIIPPDDFPGAAEAGAVEYIDRQLSGHFRDLRNLYRTGLAAANELSLQQFGRGFTAATFEQQTLITRRLEGEQPQFFTQLLNHTMQGFYGSPRHGGNRDAVSWHMLGLDEPPLRGRAQFDLRGRS